MEPGLWVVYYGIEGKKKGKLVKLLYFYLPDLLRLWQFFFKFFSGRCLGISSLLVKRCQL